MKLHFLFLFSTIVISRVILWFVRDDVFMEQAKTDNWHHAYTGAILFLVSVVVFRRQLKTRSILSGVGFGLLFDEITVPMCWFGYPVDYWSIGSWGSTILMSVGYFAWQRRLGRV